MPAPENSQDFPLKEAPGLVAHLMNPKAHIYWADLLFISPFLAALSVQKRNNFLCLFYSSSLDSNSTIHSLQMD